MPVSGKLIDNLKLSKALTDFYDKVNNKLNTKEDKGHTHSYAGSSSVGGAANSVRSNFTISLNGGSTEGTNRFTFNGSAAKTINITPSLVGSPSNSTFESAVAQATDEEIVAMLESILV